MASLLVGAWAAPQRTNDWVLDSTCGKTLGELSRLAQSLPATILPTKTDRSPARYLTQQSLLTAELLCIVSADRTLTAHHPPHLALGKSFPHTL